VVSCYFNPCGYRTRAANLHAFVAALRRQRIRYLLAELSFDGRYELPAGDTHVLRLRGHDVMWHKERLLNLLVARLPSGVDKVAWVDADVIFPDRGWQASASVLLESYPLVQLFSHVVTAEADGRRALLRPSLAHAVASRVAEPFRLGLSYAQPGLAWAARRDLLYRVGLFDAMVVGGADTLMALAAYGYFEHPRARGLPDALGRYWRSWALDMYRHTDGSVGCVPQRISTLWHGTFANRRYVQRQRILTEARFDPATDLATDGQGVYRWASAKPALHEGVREYFYGRREDSAA